MTDFYAQDLADFQPLMQKYALRNQDLFLKFKEDIGNDKHPILKITQDIQSFSEIDAFTEQLKRPFKTLIVLGTGGSSLGARAIAQWFGFHNNPLLNKCDFNFFAADNLDDLSFSELLDNIDFETTYFLIISKSGNTVETNVQMQAIFQKLKNCGKSHLISEIMAVVTQIQARKNDLVLIAEEYHIPILKHSLSIGGRYSVFTMTGLLPTALMGFDYKAILRGAQSVINQLNNVQNFTDSAPCYGAAALIAGEYNGLLTHIFAAYGDRFSDFSIWIRQLWAESLGKSAKGGLFVPSINPLDQHSQLQMYYDGIDNKTYSFIECQLKDSKKLQLTFDTKSQFYYLNQKTVHDVVTASCLGTMASLRSKGRLIRKFSIENYSAEALGALMMHFMIETIFASYLLQINPYDQPAVEDYKNRTKTLLKD